VTHAIERSARLGVSAESLTASGAAVLTVAVGAVNGGYFPTSWGWIGLVLGWGVLVAALLRRDVALNGLGVLYAGAAVAFVGWVALSIAWSANPSQTVLEVERDVVYVAAVLAVLLARRVRPLLGGVVVGIVLLSVYALGTRLLPERLGSFDPVAGYRLSEPLGYWNALGVFAVMGTLLALGFAADARGLVARAFAGVAPVVLVPTLYFTFSRGGWLALAVGLVVVLALHPRRFQLLTAAFAIAPAAAITVGIAWRSPALTSGSAHLADATGEGHRLAAWLVVLAVLGAALSVANGALERRWQSGSTAQRAVAAFLLVVLAAACLVAIVQYGSPVAIGRDAWRSFSATPKASGTSLNNRLFSFSGSGRVTQWRIAADEYGSHSWLGTGAGTFEQYWNRDRPVPGKVRDVHNLYLEVLAELGPIGLALLVVFLAVPLVAFVRARARPIVPAAAAAYAAFLAHAAVDWDWELVVVTLVAVACAGAAVSAAGGKQRGGRVGIAAVATVVIVVAFVGFVGNSQGSRAANALRAGAWESAATHARKAHTWAPWSSEPYRLLGEAELAQGHFAGARTAFRKAIDRYPSGWELWFDLARTTTGAAQQRALAQASTLNPLSPEIAEFRSELRAGWEPGDEIRS
jgi:O-antigen ligase